MDAIALLRSDEDLCPFTRPVTPEDGCIEVLPRHRDGCPTLGHLHHAVLTPRRGFPLPAADQGREEGDGPADDSSRPPA